MPNREALAAWRNLDKTVSEQPPRGVPAMIYLDQWLVKRREYKDFKQTDYEGAEEGFCMAATLFWISRCMVQDAASQKGLTKYRNALDDLKLTVPAVLGRFTLAQEEKAGAADALRGLAASMSDLQQENENRQSAMAALKTEHDQIAQTALQRKLTPTTKARADDIVTQAKDHRSHVQANSKAMANYSAQSDDLYAQHFTDVGGGAMLSNAYLGIAATYNLQLHSGASGPATAGFGATVAAQIHPTSYFIYILRHGGHHEKEGGRDSHAIAGFRSDGAGWGPFAGTSYLTMFDPNTGVFRCPFSKEGGTFIERIHRAYLEADHKTTTYSHWKLAVVSSA
jgi:hypothetical protein